MLKNRYHETAADRSRPGFAKKLAGMALAAGFLGWSATPATAQWSLPYARPAAYNYSTLYAPNLNAYLNSNPDFFKTELQNSWVYWKQNFMMQNGLVNHRRLQGTTVIGTNEAVSEGQGYGMLLSVLLNDQATFNRIFEAANSQLWDGGKKSYRWVWPNGSSGAATDADLDIALALIFADDLQKAKLWQSYNQGGVTYNSRAMDIIKSIRTNMTSQNFLLPGDSWGGEGINNLNPSYFAPAWFKVFNAYQKEVDFTPVIASCYSVLAKVPRYSFGQAPDWCNQSGGQASQAGGKPEQGMGMLSDGIRVPWRIGMDALWFKDERAIAYCKNTMKTLTEYNNANINMMAAQMAHYNKNGTTVTETRGSFDNMAMWMTAVMGSWDPAYSQKGTNSILVARIVGTSAPYFGDLALQDEKFYYKQSIAMLGLAAIGGQFPNLLSDVKNPVNLAPLAPRRLPAAAEKLLSVGTPAWKAGSDASAPWRNALGRQILLP